MLSRKLSFVATIRSPEQRRLHLTHTGVVGADWLGWELAVSQFDEHGREQPFADHWELTLFEILRYIEVYSDERLDWRWADDGSAASPEGLQPSCDASRYFDRALKVITSHDGQQRVCLGRYDDGSYRFVWEQHAAERGLTAWLEKRSSRAMNASLEAAETEARNEVDWLTCG